MGEDRRRYPRAHVELDVTVDVMGRQWRGKTLAVSPYGAKGVLPGILARLPGRTTVDLGLALPDGHVPLALTACVRGTDPDGVGLSFDSLGSEDFERLRHFVDSVFEEEWREVLRELEGHPPRDEATSGSPGGRTESRPDPSPQQDDVEKARLQSLLRERGFKDLQLPDGALAPQWREFLRGLGAGE
jgi:hypothetical protein